MTSPTVITNANIGTKPAAPPPTSVNDHPAIAPSPAKPPVVDVIVALGNGYFEQGGHLITMGKVTAPAPVIFSPKPAGAPPATGNDYDVILRILVQTSEFTFGIGHGVFTVHDTPGISQSRHDEEAILSRITYVPPGFHGPLG